MDNTMNGMMMYNYFFGKDLKNGKLGKIRKQEEYIGKVAHFSNIALNTFQWESGEVESIDWGHAEKVLLKEGKVAIAMDDELGLIALSYSDSEDVNIYGYSPYITLYGAGGYRKEFKAYMPGADNTDVKAVRIFDNPEVYPYINFISSQSYEAATARSSRMVALNKMKNPHVFVGTKNNEREIKQYFESVKDDEEAILISDPMDYEQLSTIDTRVDTELAAALTDVEERAEEKLIGILGSPNNQGIDKEERLITSEVNINTESTDRNLDFRLRERQIAAKIINEVFGTNIEVKIRHEIFKEEIGIEYTEINSSDGINIEEVDVNEDL